MESECAVMLSSVVVSKSNVNKDIGDLTRNWTQLSDKIKESNLVFDLINVLSGLDSIFFSWNKNGISGEYDIFMNPIIQKDFGPATFEMCSEILDIRIHQSSLLNFINITKKSYICQSLSEEIVTVLEDLQECVAKFNELHIDSFLGIEKLFNYLKPAKQTLILLSNVVADIDNGRLLNDKSNMGILILDSLEQKCKSELGVKRELLQHLFNVCIGSYFHLIKNYVLYSSLNGSVVDFFIKYGTEDEYKTYCSELKQEGIYLNNDADDQEFKQYYEHDDMQLWIDKRYVPRVFKSVEEKVFQTGMFLKVMNKNINYELVFKSVDNLIADLDEIYRIAYSEVCHHLKSKSNVDMVFKLFFDFCLFRKSEYINNVMAMLNENVDLYYINVYLNEKIRKGSMYNRLNVAWENMSDFSIDSLIDSEDENYSPTRDVVRNSTIYLSFDNLKNLTYSMKFFDYYGHLKSGSKDCLQRNKHYKNENESMELDNGNEPVDTDKVANTNSSSGGISIKLMPNELDYRNVVFCCNLDRVNRLVFTDRILYKYKLMFKFLFQLKYTEYCLNQLSIYHMKTCRIPVEPYLVGRLNIQLFTVARMNQFVKTLLHHFLVDVVLVKTEEFLLVNYNDLFSLNEAHKLLLDYLFESMLLADSELMSSLQHILLLAVKFSTELLNFLDNPSYVVDYPKLDLINSSELNYVPSSVHLTANNLNCLLNNPGYCNMVQVSRVDFDNNLKNFKSLIRKSNYPLKRLFE